ncbi:hypothetical protein VP1G_10704 [Cytospora mali]|uniref:Uncharacterized protein n=1 Tax=Cytospora mali TaxID=578113 RepID=A0A194USI6_CYTMA|nr:hypothetical protein VP1G_10704 [Valsa mali var. pyri (nom. inval.)]
MPFVATNTSRTRPFSIASLFFSRNIFFALFSSLLSTACRPASSALGSRARTGSARFLVDTFAARILDMEFAKASGSLRLDLTLRFGRAVPSSASCSSPELASSSRSEYSSFSSSSPLSESASSSEGGVSLAGLFLRAIDGAAPFFFFCGGALSSASESDPEPSDPENDPSSTCALWMSSSSESSRFTAWKSCASSAGSSSLALCVKIENPHDILAKAIQAVFDTMGGCTASATCIASNGTDKTAKTKRMGP